MYGSAIIESLLLQNLNALLPTINNVLGFKHIIFLGLIIHFHFTLLLVINYRVNQPITTAICMFYFRLDSEFPWNTLIQTFNKSCRYDWNFYRRIIKQMKPVFRKLKRIWKYIFPFMPKLNADRSSYYSIFLKPVVIRIYFRRK